MHRLIASWFGTGLLLRRIRGTDSGSGTVGALTAGVVAYAIYQEVDLVLQVIAALVVILAGLWSVRALVDTEGDAGWIVVDEAAGVFIALIGLAAWEAAATAYLVFRAADIFKRFFPGVFSADRLGGAIGVMADDVIAGIYGLAAGHLVQTLV